VGKLQFRTSGFNASPLEKCCHSPWLHTIDVTDARQGATRERAIIRAFPFTAKLGAMRHDSGNDLAPVAPIDAKVAIQRYDYALRFPFGHSHKASVSQRHWNICELFHECPQRFYLWAKAEFSFDYVSRQ
jgi:hypothetical protein